MTKDSHLRALGVSEKKVRRARLEAELGARQRALPDKRYGVILADPPWRFEPYIVGRIEMTTALKYQRGPDSRSRYV